MTRWTGAALVAATLAAATPAGAQVPAAPPTPVTVSAPVVDSLPSFERPNGALLRTGTLSYVLTVVKPTGETIPLGTRTVVISDAPLGGNPGWLIAESRTGTAVSTFDSVFVARGDLSPERWTAAIGKGRLGASITRDSLFGAIDTYQGRASFAMALPANALLSAGMVERIIEMLPLREGYRSAATLVLIDGSSPQLLAAELVVERSERVNAGDHEIDAWRVALRAGAVEERLWVSRDGARVVRTEQAIALGVLTSTLMP